MDSDEVRRQWAERSGAYSPEYYAYYGPNETSELIRARLDAALDPDAAVLELGCSSGRHLAHLLEHGYENLHGVEINDEAFDVMADAYPRLAEEGTFYADAIEAVVPEFETGQFDAVYSVETLQHIHPDDEWVFDEIARITDGLLVTVESERADDPTDDGRASTDAESGGADDTEVAAVDGAAVEDVNYVHDEFPLYYRDWERVFGERGFEEVTTTETKRDTLRAFRADGY
ncbi:class I SAM-dependent methyltransferase [Halorussus marinus]|uniref:class I SAM-dependent methyltransferase n=1 Tax=Halorussus marinus TaxID=2505976 RepID=UPI00106DF12C|nr:class I SAM-dependent methyltransferase [Halorussus marinus]